MAFDCSVYVSQHDGCIKIIAQVNYLQYIFIGEILYLNVINHI